MKQQFSVLSCLGILILLINIYCGKSPGNRVQPNPHPANTAPVVSINADAMIYLPFNSVLLIGSAEDKESNIASYCWKKIEGPSSYSFGDSTKLSTQVSGLSKGYYAFELTVTDSKGLVAKAYVRIMVAEATAGRNEIIFSNLTWSCVWDCSLGIPNISSQIPGGNPVAVFIKRKGGLNSWVLAGNQWDMQGYNYVHFISYGELIITNLITNDLGGDTPDIKIIY